MSGARGFGLARCGLAAVPAGALGGGQDRAAAELAAPGGVLQGPREDFQIEVARAWQAQRRSARRLGPAHPRDGPGAEQRHEGKGDRVGGEDLGRLAGQQVAIGVEDQGQRVDLGDV